LSAVGYPAFPLFMTAGDAEMAHNAVTEWLTNLAQTHDAISKNTGAVCMFQTLEPRWL
jgi:hypothetical protein